MDCVSQDNRRGKRNNPKCQNQRRLSIYQRYGPFSKDTKGAVITRAIHSIDLEKAYSLLHDTFVENGYILPRKSGMRVRPFETSVETATFVAKSGERVVGIQTIIPDSDDLGLPSDVSFRKELDSLRSPGSLLCEAANEALDKEFRKSAVSTELMRCLFAQAWHIGCTHLVTAVSKCHKQFYEFIGFEQIGDARNNTDEIDDPVILMCWNIGSLWDKWKELDSKEDTIEAFWKNFCLVENPYIVDVEFWTIMARTQFENSPEIIDFFGKCVDLFTQCNPDEQQAMRRRLGDIYPHAYNQAVHPQAWDIINDKIPVHRTSIPSASYNPKRSSRLPSQSPSLVVSHSLVDAIIPTIAPIHSVSHLPSYSGFSSVPPRPSQLHG